VNIIKFVHNIPNTGVTLPANHRHNITQSLSYRTHCIYSE